MKHYRRFLLLLAMLPIGTFAKDNFKMTGKIDGVGAESLPWRNRRVSSIFRCHPLTNKNSNSYVTFCFLELLYI